MALVFNQVKIYLAQCPVYTAAVRGSGDRCVRLRIRPRCFAHETQSVRLPADIPQVSVDAGSELETKRSGVLRARLQWLRTRVPTAALIVLGSDAWLEKDSRCTRHVSSRPDQRPSPQARLLESGAKQSALGTSLRASRLEQLVNTGLRLGDGC